MAYTEEWKLRQASIAARTGFRLPHFVDPIHKRAIDWVGIAFIVATAAVSFFFLQSSSTGKIGGGLVFVVLVATFCATAIQKRLLPRPLLLTNHTLGELTQSVVALNARADCQKQWTNEKIWLVLKQIVAEQFGVAPASVTKSSRLIEDLGC